MCLHMGLLCGGVCVAGERERGRERGEGERERERVRDDEQKGRREVSCRVGESL